MSRLKRVASSILFYYNPHSPSVSIDIPSFAHSLRSCSYYFCICTSAYITRASLVCIPRLIWIYTPAFIFFFFYFPFYVMSICALFVLSSNDDTRLRVHDVPDF